MADGRCGTGAETKTAAFLLQIYPLEAEGLRHPKLPKALSK